MNAYLLLANGMVFAGQSVGAEGVTVGEVVFATGMVGFQETLTDPSYYGQIITQTYPLIGNYGMNKDDMESDKIWAKGYIVREACQTPSNWRCEETLDSFLKKNNTIGIEGIDTRHLTRIIRESGVMNGAILTTFDPADPANKAETDKLLEEIRAYAVTDAVKSVTCAEPEIYNEKGETHIVLMHYGCKRNIIRCLVKRGCKVTVMPAFATAEEVAALDPDGIMLSNGPGDPAEPVEVIENLKHIFELNIPTFGICLGHQLSALAEADAEGGESKHYATLLQWDNIYYQPTPEIVSTKTTVRVGLVQWQMRPYKGLDDVFEQVEFFVDAVSDYKSDFILFPEYFNAPLMAKFNHMSESEAIRELAKYTDEMLNRFINLAISYNINIITGSMPLIKDDGLYNVGFLCRRDGSYETYEKVHITPDEAKSWGLSGGKMVRTFETDCAKIGVLICYDVEFPELSRIMADQGMQILFVPFLTDTQNAYSRVRVCAQARAIENECFVVIAGSVGNLPRVHNMDIQYAQSGVFTPCDFAFPTDGKRAEATPNTEMILVSDVDLDLLNELHTYGSVRNLKDRRHDLYEVKMKRK